MDNHSVSDSVGDPAPDEGDRVQDVGVNETFVEKMNTRLHQEKMIVIPETEFNALVEKWEAKCDRPDNSAYEAEVAYSVTALLRDLRQQYTRE